MCNVTTINYIVHIDMCIFICILRDQYFILLIVLKYPLVLKKKKQR